MLLNAARKKYYTDVELTTDELDMILRSLSAYRRDLARIYNSKLCSADFRADAQDDDMEAAKLAERLHQVWYDLIK